jgi:hypothetical protein
VVVKGLRTVVFGVCRIADETLLLFPCVPRRFVIIPVTPWEEGDREREKDRERGEGEGE